MQMCMAMSWLWVKATTGGSIYYGLLAAQLAADTIHTAFATVDFSAAGLQTYERAWRALLADELRHGLWFRKLYGWLGARQIDSLLQAIAHNGLKDVIRRQAHFDWHRELIMGLGRRLPLGKIALGTLLGL
jgi:digeranylgeranylglycerophospholipid reductase